MTLQIADLVEFKMEYILEAYLSGYEIQLNQSDLLFKGNKIGKINGLGTGQCSILFNNTHSIQVRGNIQLFPQQFLTNIPQIPPPTINPALKYYPSLSNRLNQMVGIRRLDNASPNKRVKVIQPENQPNLHQQNPPQSQDIKELRSILDLGLGEVNLPMRTPSANVLTPLLTHQKQALHWLIEIENNPKSGFKSSAILADDMGLGKTLTMISLIADSRHNVDVNDRMSPNEDLAYYESQIPINPTFSKSTLIIVPKSLISNWLTQIQQHTDDISVCVYNNKTSINDLQLFDVILATYGTLVSDFKKSFKIKPKEALVSNPITKGSALYFIYFYRVILDEAHKVINSKTLTNLACTMIQSHRRYAVTATPLVNSIDDIYGLLRYLRCNDLSVKSVWGQFIMAYKHGKGGNRLKSVLSQLCLRRTKKTMINGKLIIELPPKTEIDVFFELTAEQIEVYQQLRLQTIKDYKNMLLSGRNITIIGMFTLLLRQRQFCLHPQLGFKSILKHLKKTAIKHVWCMDCSSLHGTLITSCNHVFCSSCLNRPTVNDSDDINVDLDQEEHRVECLVCNKALTDEDIFDKSLVIESSDKLELDLKNNPDVNGKVQFILDKLIEFHSSDIKKSIIFCEFTQFFDILAPLLCDYKYLKLTGETKDRSTLLDIFMNDQEYTVLLSSLKVGGLGLNLNCASRCFIVNPSWNMVNEAQAIDRIYRIGQKEEVIAYRLITQDSIELNIQEIQKRKLTMFKDAFTGGASNISMQELRGIITGDSLYNQVE
eukprot:NODE_399_length_9361_cov_0.420428.p2 type:complete len:772 gc:universal NODE_399_length_9361_cov_0.420428:8533-6218(-)